LGANNNLPKYFTLAQI